MEMPTPCECGEVVELNDMRQCVKCKEIKCRDCHSGLIDYCEECADGMLECSECGDLVDREDIGRKGRCSMCRETMVGW